MSCVRNVLVLTACVSQMTLAYGLDLKYYWGLTVSRQESVCRDAARANPGVVKQLQVIAERYIKQIQSDLTALAEDHPAIAGVGKARIEVPGTSEPEKVLCGLALEKNTHSVETVSGIHQEPNEDGCILRVWVNNIIAFPPSWDRRGSISVCFLVHEMEVQANYLLSLSKENKGLAKTVRVLIERRYKEMCDEMKKLQTAEDKAAEEGQFIR